MAATRTRGSLGRRRPLSKQSLENISAAAALNFVFWSGHPLAGHMWAADYTEQFHVLRVDKATQTVSHVCGDSPYGCGRTGGSTGYRVEEIKELADRSCEERPALDIALNPVEKSGDNIHARF